MRMRRQMGYLTATISVADEITKGQPVFYNVPDSASLLQNEIPVKNLFSNGDYGVYVDGYLFFFITMDMFKDQKNSYTLYWDRSKEPTMVDNVPTYDLFLRVAKVADGTGSAASSIGEVRAFNVKSVLESVNSAEANKDSKSFNLKVNYLNTINEKDSTDLKMGFLYRSIPSREKLINEISIEVEGVPIRRLSIRPIFLPFFYVYG